MDGSVVERHTELLSAVVVEPRLGGTKISPSVVVETTDAPELLATQYMNLPRLQEIPKVQLVSDALNADLLSHHVVELASANDFGQPQVTAQYYEEDLLAHDLTEEDKRLAAALVAVQLVQQQKHQHSILASELLNGKTMTQLSPLHTVSVDKPSMMVTTSYIPTFDDDVTQTTMLESTNDRMIKLYQPTTQLSEITALPPLKKVLSNQNLLRSKYDRPTTEELNAAAPTVETIDIKTITKVSKEALHINDGSQEADEIDSDYEGEPELKSSKRSLPHKKRIPRKLKTQQSRNPAKTYKCQKCGESFTSQSALLNHRSTHQIPSKRSSAYSCEICATVCPNQMKFFEHLKTHYEPNGYPVNTSTVIHQQQQSAQHVQSQQTQQTLLDYNSASVQPVIQATFQTIKTDVEQKLEDQTLKCEQCGRTFRRQKSYEQHIAVAHPPIEEFSEPEDMMEGIRHVVNIQTDTADDDDNDKLEAWRYHDDLSITGDLCSLNDAKPVTTEFTEQPSSTTAPTTSSTTSTTSAAVPATTEKPKKRNTKTSQCPHCTRVFTHRNSLLYHIRSHSGRRPHQCEVCGKSFFAANALRVHMRMHSGDKPYKCEFCSRSFRQWGDLKYHITSLHSTQKQYQCEFCGKDFARKYSLIVHRRIHTGEKNYVCEFCRKTFRASSYLVNHRRIHTGEKPYSCDVCHKAFRAKSDMKRHRNTHNKERAMVPERMTDELIIPDADPSEAGPMLSDTTVPLNLNMRQDSSESLTYTRDPLDRGDPNTLYVWIPTPAETILSDE